MVRVAGRSPSEARRTPPGTRRPRLASPSGAAAHPRVPAAAHRPGSVSPASVRPPRSHRARVPGRGPPATVARAGLDVAAQSAASSRRLDATRPRSAIAASTSPPVACRRSTRRPPPGRAGRPYRRRRCRPAGTHAAGPRAADAELTRPPESSRRSGRHPAGPYPRPRHPAGVRRVRPAASSRRTYPADAAPAARARPAPRPTSPGPTGAGPTRRSGPPAAGAARRSGAPADRSGIRCSTGIRPPGRPASGSRLGGDATQASGPRLPPAVRRCQRGAPASGVAVRCQRVAPRPSMRRALRRAADGRTLDVAEAAVLLAARGEDLDELLAVAGTVRDAGLREAGRPGVVTYSRKVFIPLTRLCRDRCHYCTFVTVPHRLPAPYLERDEVLAIARGRARPRAARRRCSRSATGRRSAGRRPGEWLRRARLRLHCGLSAGVAIAVLEETGLLPHLNPGVLSWAELQRLKPVAPSMGMMLETTAQPAVVGAGRPALRLARQGAGGAAAGAGGRRPGRRPVHHRHPHRHRRDPGRAGRVAVRDPPGRPASTGTSRKSSSRTSAPSRTPRCAAMPDAELRRAGRDRGGGPAGTRAEGAHPGAAQPGRRERVRAAAAAPASTTGAASRR